MAHDFPSGTHTSPEYRNRKKPQGKQSGLQANRLILLHFLICAGDGHGGAWYPAEGRRMYRQFCWLHYRALRLAVEVAAVAGSAALCSYAILQLHW